MSGLAGILLLMLGCMLAGFAIGRYRYGVRGRRLSRPALRAERILAADCLVACLFLAVLGTARLSGLVGLDSLVWARLVVLFLFFAAIRLVPVFGGLKKMQRAGLSLFYFAAAIVAAIPWEPFFAADAVLSAGGLVCPRPGPLAVFLLASVGAVPLIVLARQFAGMLRRDLATGLGAGFLLLAVIAFCLGDLVPFAPELLAATWLLPVVIRFGAPIGGTVRR